MKLIGFYGVNACSTTNVDTVSVLYCSHLLSQMCSLPSFVFYRMAKMTNNCTFSTGKEQ